MASNSIFKNFRESLNSWLINVAGVSLTDISNKDPFSNKFNIFLFASLMAMLTAFLTLFVIACTYECCFAAQDKKRFKKQKKRAASITYRDFGNVYEMHENI
uniref:uncharacterized protein LOC100175644 n=1 Tax=Ciona intestinalis TaxID=7719 RepID=UPI00006A3EA6|nr:uncharacterized protein LOC100175644 [Ciona intestinalis]|eukprot:XP_002126096.1 uncharacterized protein LOC100175644 [Ciona intestinalis]